MILGRTYNLESADSWLMPARFRLKDKFGKTTAVIDDLENAKVILEKLRQLGIFVSLDDFGTGYSSLSIICQLPIDELKIDESFISDIETNKHDLSLVQSIISIGKSLSIPVLEQGVETLQQARILADNQCDIFQGYFYSKPLKITELKEFIKTYHP